jgi:hypothetical protein
MGAKELVNEVPMSAMYLHCIETSLLDSASCLGKRFDDSLYVLLGHLARFDKQGFLLDS